MAPMASGSICIWAAVILPGTIFYGQKTSVEAAARANYSVLSVPIPWLFKQGNPPTGFIPDVMAELGKAGKFDYHFTQIPAKAAFGNKDAAQKFTGAMATFLANEKGPNKLDIYAAALETDSGYDAFVDFLTPLYQSNVTTVYNTKRVTSPPDIVEDFKEGLTAGTSQGWTGVLSGVTNMVNDIHAWLNKQEIVVLDNTMTIDFLKNAYLKKTGFDERILGIANAVDNQRKQTGFPVTYESAAACVNRDDKMPCTFVGRTPAIENTVRDSKGKLALDKRPLKTVWGAFAIHNNAALRTILNAELRKLHNKGIIANRFKKWFPASTFIKPSATTTKYW